MKKMMITLAIVLTAVIAVTVAFASADNTAATALTPSQSMPAAAGETAPAAAAPAAPVDQAVGAWKNPRSVYNAGEFDSYTVLKEDGTFLFVTNLYTGNGGYDQKVTGNEKFRWSRIGSTTYELRYDYGDANGEFVSELEYNPKDDCFYFFGELYGTRDPSFTLNSGNG